MMAIEISCGGIVFKRENNSVLVKMIVAGNGANDSGYTLPKGHIDDGETEEQAAVREVKEECGAQKVKVLDKVGQCDYKLRSGNHKIVHIFLMECIEDGEPNDPDNEVVSVEWIAID